MTNLVNFVEFKTGLLKNNPAHKEVDDKYAPITRTSFMKRRAKPQGSSPREQQIGRPAST
jgi:hypothetical protein